MNQRTALICDRYATTLNLLDSTLSQLGFTVTRATDGRRALELAFRKTPSLLITDAAIPGGGVTLCRALREHETSDHTFIMVMAESVDERVELEAFSAGADDFVRKPLNSRVIAARIKALFRREASVSNQGVLQAADLSLISDELQVKQGSLRISLTAREFSLLYLLASKPGRVLRRDHLLDAIWGGEDVYDRTVDVYVKRLREKIPGEYIETVRGVGYRFTEQTERGGLENHRGPRSSGTRSSELALAARG